MTLNNQTNTKHNADTKNINTDIQDLILQHERDKGEINIPKRLVENFISIVENDIKRMETRRDLLIMIRDA